MKRILLVDDSTDFLKILAQALERDFEVHTATGVSEAMAIIGEIEMDSICSDLEMKDRTGLDILDSLRKNHIEIPFILMSGKDDCFEIKIAKCYLTLITVDRRTLQIVLLKMQGYSTKEIAPLVHLTAGAIYARLDHLRKKLRKIL